MVVALLGFSRAAEAQSPLPDDFNPGADDVVYAMAVQPDGKFVVGGSFTNLVGQVRKRIARFNADGTLDAGFDPGANDFVCSLMVQPDGKILVGGGFTTLAGQTRNRIGRLNVDGTLDVGFNPGANWSVLSLALQPDGKILVGGQFTTMAGQTRNRIGRLNVDGTLDVGFNPGASSSVYSLAVQADGKILVGGYFTTVGGQTRNGIARLNADGSLDAGFNPNAGAYNSVYALAVQSDAKILVGGDFMTIAGQTRNRIARLNADGSLDVGFNPNPSGYYVYSMAVQADGKILVGGDFTTVAGQTRNRIARLNADGTTDPGFNPGANGRVYSIGVQADGRILVGGDFTTLAGQPRRYLARLHNTGESTQALIFDGSTVTWLRGGTGPEVWRTTFERATDGASWTMLGAGNRTVGGWSLGGVSGGGTIRARGYVASGYQDGSAGIVESTIGPPVIASQPQGRTNAAGTAATFDVGVAGTGPFSYRWRKDGADLADGGSVAGAATAMLSLSGVLRADEGDYDVIVGHAGGSLTSAVARLTVIDPVINEQPVSQVGDVGGSVTFSVGAGGSALGYQWRKDGEVLAGETNAWLSLTNLGAAAAGTYDVVVSGTYGSVTSAAAILTLNYAALDTSFNPGANGSVYSLAVQPDGKILVGGYFTTLGGQARNSLARLTADGDLDATFSTNATSDYNVHSLAVQSDGKVVVGGYFWTLAGQARDCLGRLNADGTLDAGFNPGASSSVFSLAVQSDGKILVGGPFSTLAGQTRGCIGRLNADGSLDTGFNPGAENSVLSLALQADGKIVAGGHFKTLGGQTRNYLGRINGNGTLDTGFNPGASGSVYSLAMQSDGKVLVGGSFTNVAGQARNRIARLNANGTIDTSFNPDADNRVCSIAVQADGKILVAGHFTTIGGQAHNRVARLNSDGTVDAVFNPGANAEVLALAVQSDGRILVGGSFTSLAGQARNCIARLRNTGEATEALSHEGSTVTWLRGGAAPEVWRTTFERTTDGASWTMLGAGTRTAGGWSLGGVSGGGTIRARGHVASGWVNGSAGIVESTIGPPVIASQPQGRTNAAGTTATFDVGVAGTGPFTYRWRRDGLDLFDGGSVFGATNAMLSLSGVLRADEGAYDVIVGHAGGSLTSAVARLAVIDPAISVSPANQTGQVGGSATLSVAAGGTGAGFQWRKDGAILPGATNAWLSLTNLGASDAGNYDVVVSGTYGSVTSVVAMLTVNGALPEESFSPHASSSVSSLAVQPDGKVLVGGDFTSLAGQSRNRIGRINADGTLDTGFNPAADSTVYAIAVQADGKILAGGSFTHLSGQARNRIGRINADGTLDTTFNPGADSVILSLAAQSDGKILVGGIFTTLGGQTRNYLGRINANGTLDIGFNPNANSRVWSLCVQPDGKILAGGNFTTMGGQSRNYVARLNADGTLDTSFNPNPSSSVRTFSLQWDGKILVGGDFTTMVGQTRKYIARLNPDGTLDAGFNPGTDDYGYVYSIVVQADGRILVGGSFTTLAGQGRYYIARLNSDGTLDPSFDPGADSTVYALAVQGDGKILLGGDFGGVNGETHARIARLLNTGEATEDLSYNGSAITWLRGGTGPEVWRTTFEHSAGGSAWTMLGAGARIAGGWSLGGVSVTGGTIRARGYAVGGQYDGSAGIVESTIGPPVIVGQPQSRTNAAGTTATFDFTVSGTEPLAYRWREGGAPLSDGGKVSGATSATLSIADVLRADEGAFDVICTNAYGAVTSAVATLTVMDPGIIASPQSQTRQRGESVTLSVTAGGTGSLLYQWRKDGAVLAGQTNAWLSLGNLGGSDAGNYDVVVSGAYGSVTSAAAALSVYMATLDSGFNPGADNAVVALAQQPDGRIVAGGYFTNLAGGARNHIGRLKEDGTLDGGFDPGANSNVYALAVQPDGKIVAAGEFTSLGGQARSRMGRINADGSLDTGFNPGPNSWVYSLAMQSDGKILAGGGFTTLGGQTRNCIGRLNADGSLDTGFNPGANNTVASLAVQADGKILMGGYFTTAAGQARNRIARVNANGTVDSGFNPGADNWVFSLLEQPDGKILVGGSFTNLAGQGRAYLARLNSNGTLDSGFNPGVVGTVRSIALEASGHILIGGSFYSVAGQTRYYVARLNADGTLDADCRPSVDNSILALAVQGDGKILLGGWFSTVSGYGRMGIARLNGADDVTGDLGYGGSTVTWLRGGASPEVWRTTFEHSTNGASWTMLGAGGRITGGWSLGGVSVGSGTIRARGYLAGGEYNASAGIVEATLGPPVIASQPQGRTNDAGTVASFDVGVAGTGPFTYRWRKDGADLADGGKVSGAATAMLSLSGVLRADEAGYDVVVGHAMGSVTSAVARLTVIDPAISVSPQSQITQGGDGVTLSVTAGGTGPLAYQWRKDGTVLPGQTNASLSLADLGASDAGNYDVIVGGSYGSVTSAAAMLTVNLATLDEDFDPGAGGLVLALAAQPDGKVLAGGYFTNLAGQARSRIGRLNSDGTLDVGFDPGANSNVFALAVQPDGKIVVGGLFTSLAGQLRNHIARLNADGALDAGFTADSSGYVYALAPQADGKILVGGNFVNLNGQARYGLGRLNSDGTLDAGFDPRPNATVASIAIQPDGRILAGGEFTTLSGQPRSGIGRINADGTLDSGFNPGANGAVMALAAQADGKILVGGAFTTLAGQGRKRLARLNPNGTIDATFIADADDVVFSLAVQTDGGILVGGAFTTVSGQSRLRLARLKPDGTLDLTFGPSADDWVFALAVDVGGKILAGGRFGAALGEPRSYIARLLNTGPATQELGYDGSVITWLRGGTGPETWRTTFEHSGNGTSWTMLGAGNRAVGGWSLGGVSVGPGTIRARGYMQGGYFCGSAGIVEASIGPPVIVGQPQSRTNVMGTTAAFEVGVAGSGPFTYRWRKDGTDLSEGGNVSGATNAMLNLSGVQRADEGGYDAVVGHAMGSVTSALARLVVADPGIVTGPQGQTGQRGGDATFSVTASGTGSLVYQWRKDGEILPGETNAWLSLANLGPSHAGGYDVVVSGTYGSVTSASATLSVYLATLDGGFDPGPDGATCALAVQPDGRILVGGLFTNLGGQARNYVGRLNPDGTLDESFDPGANDEVYSLAVQPDGKIIVGGYFTSLAGQPRNRLGRLNEDGTLDGGFNPGANSWVVALAAQPDGKVLVGGAFTNLAGQARRRVGRLNADGTIDAGFNPGADGEVYSLALQPDGKILAGGYFTNLAGQARNRLGRLNADGTLDAGFNPGADSWVEALAVQPDGKIVVGGSFTNLAGQARGCLGRLNADGTLDAGFAPDVRGTVRSIAIEAGGHIIVVGEFTSAAGQARYYVARLNVDGTLDADCRPSANSWVLAVAVQADGKILLGGWFTALDGQWRNHIGRLNGADDVTGTLGYDGSTVTWLRGGAAPEVWRTTFEHSTNGASWTMLGAGNRVGGGWSLGGVAAGPGTIRARGHVASGAYNGSAGIVETTFGAPVVVAQPQGRTNAAGTTATFECAVSGSEPLAYRWRKDGVDLADGGNVSGASAPDLSIAGVLRGDGGAYDVICTNAFGAVTSAVAILTVADPGISVAPQGQTGERGQDVTLSVTAGGSGQLVYQWRKYGEVLSGETNAWLSLSDLGASHAGDYDVVVSGTYGSVTSAPATLSVYLATLDGGFDPGADSLVNAFAVQPDGKILVGGYFTNLSGQARTYIGRLNADGTIDGAFDPGANSNVYALAVAPDGGIVAGGEFTALCGQARNCIGRLNADGTLDLAFNPGANEWVYSLAMQADGKVLVGGGFTDLAGQARNYIGRLNGDGSLDTGFDPNANDTIASLAVQPNGKILMGGVFSAVGGQGRNRIARLNADGTLDAGFNPGADNWVVALAVQPDGKILVGGSFTNLAGQGRAYVARLNADGTLDAGFAPDVRGTVRSIALEAGGHILIGGEFTSVGGQARYYVARLNADGTLDADCNPDPDDWVYALAIGADGKVLVGGWFTSLDGEARSCIARLNGADDVTETLGYDGSTVTWLRGGAGPEFWRTTFEHSAGGVSWTSLGAGARVSGGWELGGLSVTGGTIRARGYTVSGRYNGSVGIVEAMCGSPFIITQPVGSTVDVGEVATFGVSAGGAGPITYRWRKDGVELSDGGGVSGAGTDTLTISGAALSHAGNYSVSVSNASGSMQSAEAALAVVDLVVAPLALAVPEGSNAAFTVQLSAAPAGDRTVTTARAGGDADLGVSSGATLVLGATNWSVPQPVTIAAAQDPDTASGAATFTVSSDGLTIQTVTAREIDDDFPEIVVESPGGGEIGDGGGWDAGPVRVGSGTNLTFTIRNAGVGQLAGIGVTIDGTGAPDWGVTAAPAEAIGPDESTAFTVRFAPSRGGVRGAEVHIASTDADENPFDINLSGEGTAADEDDDGDGVTNGAEVNLAALGFDFDPHRDDSALRALLHDNAAGLGLYHPSQMGTMALGRPVLENDADSGHFHLSIGVLQSPDMRAWTPLTNFSPTYDPDTGMIDLDITPDTPELEFLRVIGEVP